MPTILLFFVPEPPPAVDLPRGHGGGRAGRQPVTPMPLPMVNQTGRATGNWQAPPRPAGAHRGQPAGARPALTGASQLRLGNRRGAGQSMARRAAYNGSIDLWSGAAAPMLTFAGKPSNGRRWLTVIGHGRRPNEREL
jgi:hypothetical protein